MLSDVERRQDAEGLGEAVKAFEEYEVRRNYIQSRQFKHDMRIPEPETSVERAARLRKQGKSARAKRITRKKN